MCVVKSSVCSGGLKMGVPFDFALRRLAPKLSDRSGYACELKTSDGGREGVRSD